MNYLMNIPEKIEENSIIYLFKLAEESKCKIIIPTVSSAVAMLKSFKINSDYIKIGTTYSFLYFSAEDIKQSEVRF